MTTFSEEAMKISENHRCIQKDSGKWNLPMNYCLFGVPPEKSFGWQPLKEVPWDSRGFYFYLGAQQEKLIEAFAQSHFPETIEFLALGNCSYNSGKKHDGLNYTYLVEMLSKATFPNLKEFDCGVWETFHNEDGLYPVLGDLTGFLNKMPILEKLRIHGGFELTKDLQFPKLNNIEVQLGEMGHSNRTISNKTLECLLNSRYSSLRELWIDVEFYNDNIIQYELTDIFLSGKFLPLLRKLEINGVFKKGEKKRLIESALGISMEIMHLQEMITIDEV